MTAWDANGRAFIRDQARMHPHGMAATLAGLIDQLEAAETRAAEADALRARLAAAEKLHQPESGPVGVVCCTCLDADGESRMWPCGTAEALSGRAGP